MSAPIRVVATKPMSARRNIAVTAALAELHRAGQVPDTVRFSHHRRAVLLGRDDSFAAAYKVKSSLAGRLEIARRTSGRGTVYVSPGMLAWSVIAERYRFGAHLAEIGERICAGVAAGLARFGLPARFRPRDDVEIDGRSVCSASGAIDGSTVVFEGVVLIELDASELEAMTRLLGGVRSHADQPNAAAGVTTISEWLGRVPSDSEITDLLVAGLSHSWRRPLAPDPLTTAEVRLASRLFNEGIGRPKLACVTTDMRRGERRAVVERAPLS